MLGKLPAAVDFFTSIYGPYPFNAVGAIVDSAKVVGYSLETQTKPVFDRMPDEATLVHELSHMWFGDSVTLTTWPDIWLHEGFATWSEWIWSEHQGNKSARAVVQAALQHAAAGHRVLDAAGRGSRDAAVPLQRHGLRPRRDDARGAAREDRRHRRSSGSCATGRTRNRYGNVTTAQFIALAEQESGHGSRSTSSTSGSTTPTSRPPGSDRTRRASAIRAEALPLPRPRFVWVVTAAWSG